MSQSPRVTGASTVPSLRYRYRCFQPERSLVHRNDPSFNQYTGPFTSTHAFVVSRNSVLGPCPEGGTTLTSSQYCSLFCTWYTIWSLPGAHATCTIKNSMAEYFERSTHWTWPPTTGITPSFTSGFGSPAFG